MQSTYHGQNLRFVIFLRNKAEGTFFYFFIFILVVTLNFMQSIIKIAMWTVGVILSRLIFLREMTKFFKNFDFSKFSISVCSLSSGHSKKLKIY